VTSPAQVCINGILLEREHRSF